MLESKKNTRKRASHEGKLTKTNIFNVAIKRSLDLDEFLNSQAAVNKIVSRQVKDDWTHSVTSTLRNSLQSCGKGHFNIYESKTDVYKFTKLKKLLTRINLWYLDPHLPTKSR